MCRVWLLCQIWRNFLEGTTTTRPWHDKWTAWHPGSFSGGAGGPHGRPRSHVPPSEFHPTRETCSDSYGGQMEIWRMVWKNTTWTCIWSALQAPQLSVSMPLTVWLPTMLTTSVLKSSTFARNLSTWTTAWSRSRWWNCLLSSKWTHSTLSVDCGYPNSSATAVPSCSPSQKMKEHQMWKPLISTVMAYLLRVP